MAEFEETDFNNLNSNNKESSVEVKIGDRKDKENSRQFYGRQFYENTIRALEKSGVTITPGIKTNIRKVTSEFGKITGDKEDREGIDSLTGLKTKKVFWHDLEKIIGYTRRTYFENYRKDNPQPLSLILLDLDDFRDANKKKGYLWGDKILERLGAIIRQNMRRRSDVAARFGGEEFVIVLSDCRSDAALGIAEKLKKIIETIGVTASFGLVTSLDGSESPKELFNMANVACSIAKGTREFPSVSGKSKNRVVPWETGMPKFLGKGK